jgi:hypothetical protein
MATTGRFAPRTPSPQRATPSRSLRLLGGMGDARASPAGSLPLSLSVPSILHSLTESSKRYALLAANAFVNADSAACALASGIAVEHALKARIAAESPVFLAVGRNDAAWFLSARRLLTYAEDADAFDAVSDGVQTLGANGSFIRACAIDSSLNSLDAHVDRVLRYRNGHAHMGMAGTEELKVVFASCAKVVTEVLSLQDEFWGLHANMVDALLDDLATELRQRVEVKLAAARTEFEHRFASESSLVRSTLIQHIENARDWQIGDDRRPHECPACGSGALVYGTNRVEFDYDNHSDYPTAWVVLDANRLLCEVCHLVLDGTDELEAAGIDPEMENADVDPGDVYGEREPDEDWFLDR